MAKAALDAGASLTGAGTGYTSRVITSPDGDLVEDAVNLFASASGAQAAVVLRRRSRATAPMAIKATKASAAP